MRLAVLCLCAVFAFGCGAAKPLRVVPDDPRLRFEGHWDVTPAAATTVNAGSRLFVRFTGSHLGATFNTASVTHPAHLYVAVDGGPMRLHRLGPETIDLTPPGLGDGRHEAVLTVKAVDDRANRWVPPLASALSLTGLQLDDAAQVLPVPAAAGPRIEFLGDSITEGLRALSATPGPNGADATASYAWLTGVAFGAGFAQVGFGAQGIVAPGAGGVPSAPAAFGLNLQGSPADASFVPQAVVVNQGTNDAATPAVEFRAGYLAYLRQIRSQWPEAWIFALRPFNGTHAPEIAGAVTDAADPRIAYVDTDGWLPGEKNFTDGLHPTAAGHLIAAGKLVEAISARTGWTATAPRAPEVSRR